MKYAKLIVNPAAGAWRTAKKWPKIRSLLGSLGFRYEHDITEAPGHAVELAQEAAKKGYELVVSVGGDGTVNEVVNGLHKSGGMNDILLGIISTGTGSDYVRTIGIPRRYEDACQCLIAPRTLTVDIGLVEYKKNGTMGSRLFVNFAGLGFDAAVVKATTQKFKKLGAMPSYLMGLLTTFIVYKNNDITLYLDGQKETRRICTVMTNNGRYGGGSMLVAPQADPSDGYLDVTIINELSKLDLLWSLPRVYKGTHLTHPRITVKKAQDIAIESRNPIALQADGELLGETPVHFRILPAKLHIAV